jgi:hypothetical protein
MTNVHERLPGAIHQIEIPIRETRSGISPARAAARPMAQTDRIKTSQRTGAPSRFQPLERMR